MTVETVFSDMSDKKIRKILLIVPPVTLVRGIETKRVSEPLGLAYIGAVLLERGYEVRILDAIVEGFDIEEDAGDGRVRVGLTVEDIVAAAVEFGPDVTGISSQFTDHSAHAAQVCVAVKRALPGCVTVMGGVHPTVAPEDVLGIPELDYAVRGEAEFSFADLLEKLEAGAGVEQVDGIAFRGADGKDVIQPKKHFIDDLDSLPLPARELLNYEAYFRVNRFYRRAPIRPPAMNIITSRCCPANCIFCSTHAIMGKYRTRSARAVLDEIGTMIERYGIRELYFLDDNFTYDKRRAMEIMEGMIERKYDLAWSTPNGVAVYALDDELLGKMRESGCYSLFFAVESADPDVLKNIMHKPVDVAKIPGLVRSARALGIEVTGMFVIGLPGETREQIDRTISFAENTGFDYVTFSIATPYPGTRLFDICKREGYLVEPFDYSLLKFGRGNIRTSEFDPDYLEAIRRTAWERINMKTGCGG